MLRIFPRLFLILYALGASVVVDWYLEFETIPIVTCDSAMMQVLLSQGTELALAERISCRTSGIIGRPGGYTALVSTIVGAGAGVFGFYVNSGWNWRREEKLDD